MCRSSDVGARKGFTLVELAVVIVIIGVLAAFGVPRFLKSVERSKAAEAFNYLSAVRDAEERYIAREGIYTSSQTDLDITQVAPVYFSVTSLSSNAGTSGTDSTWSMVLTRVSGSSSYAYNVKYNQDGYDSSSSIPSEISPMGTPTGN